MADKRKIAKPHGRASKKQKAAEPAAAAAASTSATAPVDETVQRLRLLQLSAETLDIPVDIKDSVRKIRDREYEFNVPFSSAKYFHSMSWGVRDRADAILVRVVFFGRGQEGDEDKDRFYGFCVHLPPDDREHNIRHNYCTTEGPWKNWVVCNGEHNFLTDFAGRELHKFLKQDAVTAEAVLNKLSGILNMDPTLNCIACHKQLQPKVFRPSPCSEACRKTFKESWPLAIRVSPLLRDPSVLDFLLLCVSVAPDQRASVDPYRGAYGYEYDAYGRPLAKEKQTYGLPAGCPVAIDKLGQVIDSFPQLSPQVTLDDILQAPDHRDDRAALLSWMCSVCESTLVAAPPSAQVAAFAGSQFIQLNSKPERQVKFDQKLHSSARKGGSPAFHGTPPRNLFNVLCVGLRESATMDGNVFYAPIPATSMAYVQKVGVAQVVGWKNSAFRKVFVMFGVEVAMKTIPFARGESNSHQDSVMVRYCFVVPVHANSVAGGVVAAGTGLYTNTAETVQPTMSEAYTKIQSGKLLSEIDEIIHRV